MFPFGLPSLYLPHVCPILGPAHTVWFETDVLPACTTCLYNQQYVMYDSSMSHIYSGSPFWFSLIFSGWISPLHALPSTSLSMSQLVVDMDRQSLSLYMRALSLLALFFCARLLRAPCAAPARAPCSIKALPAALRARMCRLLPVRALLYTIYACLHFTLRAYTLRTHLPA